MEGIKVALMVVALSSAAACGVGGGCEMGVMADTAGWRVQDEGTFLFKLPPGYRDRMLRGIDSHIGRWERGGRVISFDGGRYTSDPRDRGYDTLLTRACVTRITGRTAVVAEWRHPESDRQNLEAWWGAPVQPDDHLSMDGNVAADDAEGRTEVFTVLRTVRFRTRWTPADRLRVRHLQCERLRAQVARGEASPTEVAANECPTGPAPPPPDYEAVR